MKYAILSLLLPLSALARPYSSSASLHPSAALALGNPQVAQTIQALGQEIGADLSLTQFVTQVSDGESDAQVCLQFEQVGPDFKRPLAAIRVEVHAKKLGGRGGFYQEVQSVQVGRNDQALCLE